MGGQVSKQIVEEGCRKKPGLQAEHSVLAGPEQSAQEISQVKQRLPVLLGKDPFGQELRHVVELGCRK